VVRRLKGKSAQFRREHNERAWLAYHIAGLHRTRKMPPIRRLMLRDRDRAPQTLQQMKGSAAQWTTLLGGTILDKG
jgi:hypothetical protein